MKSTPPRVVMLAGLALAGTDLRAAPAEKWQPDVPFSCPVTFEGSIDTSVAKLAKELALSTAQREQLKAAMRQRAETTSRGIASAEKNFADALRSVLTPMQLGKLDPHRLPRQDADDFVGKLSDMTAAQKTRVTELARLRRRETWAAIVAAQKTYAAAVAALLQPEQQRKFDDLESRDPVLRIPNR